MDLRTSFHMHINDKNARILEIGPLNRPLVDKLLYPNAFYCDIRDTMQIKTLYKSNEYLNTTKTSVPIDDIVDIDFVLKESYLETFKDVPKFDYVVASHVLEHVEDLISVVKDIMSIINPQGKFIIYYPDKRYSFDHFRAEASFRDAYDVYVNKRPALARMVLDFFNNALPENNPLIFWQANNIEELLPNNSTNNALKYYENSFSGQFIDVVHYWPFSDMGFIRFLYDCVRADLLRVSCTDFYPTLENTQEFLVILQNCNDSWNRDEELQNLRRHYKKVSSNYFNSKQLTIERLQSKITDLEQYNETLQAEYLSKAKTEKKYCEEINHLLKEKEDTERRYNSIKIEYLEQKKAINQLMHEKEQALMKLQENSDELNILINENMYLRKACQHLQDTHNGLKKQISSMNEVIKNLDNEKEHLLQEIEGHENRFKITQATYEEEIRKVIALYRTSTSWRITAPIRTIKEFLKKLRYIFSGGKKHV